MVSILTGPRLANEDRLGYSNEHASICNAGPVDDFNQR